MADYVTIVENEVPYKVSADLIGDIYFQRTKMAFGADGSSTDVSKADALPTEEGGVFHYAAGTGATTIDVPSTARLRRVAVLASTGDATITIGGGNTITVPAGGGFDEQLPGEALGADVVIGGSIRTYYVSWTTDS